MKIYRRGQSYRATFDSGLRHVFLGLVIAPSSPSSPQLIAMPMIPDGQPPSVDPPRVRREVMRAISEVEASTGIAIPLESIEYVPNDSPYYEKYYSLALDLARHIVRGH